MSPPTSEWLHLGALLLLGRWVSYCFLGYPLTIPRAFPPPPSLAVAADLKDLLSAREPLHSSLADFHALLYMASRVDVEVRSLCH